MAYEYDRLEREDSGGSFLMGLLAGTVLGAGLGMLFAPKAGAELRNQLSEQTDQLRTKANEAYSQATEKVSHIVDRGKEAYDRARGGVQNFSGGPSSPGQTPGTGTTATPGAGGFGSTNYGTGTSGYGGDRS